MADVTKINTANSNFDIKNYMKKYADVNSDGKVNIKDVTYIQKQSNNALGIQVDLNGDGKPDINNNLGLQQTGDITGDGKVDNNDVEIIKKFVSGDINDISKNIDKYQIQEFQDETQKKIFSDDLNKQKKYLEKIKATIKLMEYTRNGKDEEEPGWHWGGDALKQRDPNIHLSKEEQKEIEKKFGSLEKAKASYEVYVFNIEEAISQIDKDCKLIPYQKIQDSDKYKNSDIKNISKRYYDLLDEEYGEKNAETDTYTLSKETSKRQEQLIKIYGSLDKAKEIYGKIKYLEDKERNMYIYMLSTKGIEEADKYLDIFKKDITQRQGLSEALEFYSVLLKNGDKLTDDEVKKLLYEHIGKKDTDKIVKNAETNGITVLQCFWQGLKDGTVGFFEGLGHVFDNESEKTVSDYKKAFIAQLISSNGYTDNNGNHLSGSDILSGSYNFGSSTGNMLPVILASTLASLIASPAGGEAVFAGLTASELAGKITGSALIGLSSYGNSKHEALCNGYSLQQAIIYGGLNGLSDAGFESLLGSLPGIGTESKTWIMSVLKEGTQEYLQTYVSAGIDAIVLGETKDLSELDAEAQQSFLMGAMMGGMFNSGKLVSNIKVTIKGVNYKLTPSQIADYIKNGTKINPETGTKIEMTIEEYMKSKSKTSKNNDIPNSFDYNEIINQGYSTEDVVLEIINRHNNKYNDGWDRLLKFVDPSDSNYNNYNLITSSEGARDLLRHYTPEQIRHSMMNLNYNGEFTNISGFFRKYGDSVSDTYGCDQGGIEKMCVYIDLNTKKKYSYREWKSIVNRAKTNGQPIPKFKKAATTMEYMNLKEKLKNQGFSNRDASLIMSALNDSGACSYASFANEIFAQFNGREADFEQKFGYPMYKVENGKKILNSNELLLDMYVFANSKVNGGSFINSNNTIDSSALSNNYDAFGRQMIDSSNQAYMSYGNWTGNRSDIASIFLASKGVNYDYSCIFNHRNKGYNDPDFDGAINNARTLMSSGKTLTLDVFSKGSEIHINSTNPSQYSSMSTKIWSEGGGHSMMVTEIGSDCIYVSSWGKEYSIPFSDLMNNGSNFYLLCSDIY